MVHQDSLIHALEFQEGKLISLFMIVWFKIFFI